MLLVICGKSATGKTTLKQYLVENYGYDPVITCTTREQRIGEINGEDYDFVCLDEFNKMIDNEELIEYNFFVKGWYGTKKENINLNTNQIIILEPNGVKELLKYYDYDPRIIVFELYLCNEERYIRQIQRGDDINEIALRKEREFATFQKQFTDNYVDYIVDVNNKTVNQLCDDLLVKVFEKKKQCLLINSESDLEEYLRRTKKIATNILNK